jgi:Uma2 family endonuclease
MTAGVAISVDEYLKTVYRPDCEYLDGEVVERNVGERDHSRMQISVASYLYTHETAWGITAFTEQRVRVRATRFRVPDLAVVVGSVPGEVRILTEPPVLCIEILSREDRMQDAQEAIADYLDFGVACVWVLNPRTRRCFVYSADGMHEARDGMLRVPGTPIAVPIADLA